jgi:1,2-diacylglycerol 3-beta-galactosyltransferase
MRKKKILMPMLEAGAGHKMPALAVKSAIESLYPGKYQIDVIDYAAASGATEADKGMKGFWNFCLGHAWFVNALFALMEITHPLAKIVLPIGFGSYISKGRDYLKEYSPDIVFSTHYYAQSVAAMARDALKLPIKVITFDTDPFDAFTFWCEKRVDTLIVASERARERAVAHGMRPERVRVMPFPVNPQFLKVQKSREEILRRYGLDPSRKTILTSMGGQGIGPIKGYISRMCRKDLELNVIAVCGRNDAMRLELESLKQESDTRLALVPLGFVDNMNELLAASDLLIAKAGASTTFEALFMRVPTIFTSYAVQSERPNVEYCVGNKAGWFAPNARAFWRIMDSILTSDVLAEYKGNIEGLRLESGAEAIARFVVQELEGQA